MKEIMKQGVGLFGRLVIVTVMCFFLVISISVLCTAAFTENTGYKVYGTTDDNSEPVFLYEYSNDEGEDTRQQEYIDKGYTLTTSSVRSQLSGTGNVVFLTVTQIFCLLLMVAFIYPNLWHLGAKDSNLVRFKHKTEDTLKGLKIGAVASVPSLLLYVVFVLAGFGVIPAFPVALYQFLNCGFYSLIRVICGSAVMAGELSAWRFIPVFLLLLVVPAAAFGAYLLGYKDISLGEKFIYKKNKAK